MRQLIWAELNGLKQEIVVALSLLSLQVCRRSGVLHVCQSALRFAQTRTFAGLSGSRSLLGLFEQLDHLAIEGRYIVGLLLVTTPS